jgi:hypothetical protein
MQILCREHHDGNWQRHPKNRASDDKMPDRDSDSSPHLPHQEDDTLLGVA